MDPQFGSEEDIAEPAIETEESERAADDFENKLDMDQDQASGDVLESSHGRSDHDLDLNDGAAEESTINNELPNLEDLSALGDDPFAVVGDLDLNLELGDNQTTTDEEFSIDDEVNEADTSLGKDINTEIETPVMAESGDFDLDFPLDPENDTRGIDEPSDDDLHGKNRGSGVVRSGVRRR